MGRSGGGAAARQLCLGSRVASDARGEAEVASSPPSKRGHEVPVWSVEYVFLVGKRRSEFSVQFRVFLFVLLQFSNFGEVPLLFAYLILPLQFWDSLTPKFENCNGTSRIQFFSKNIFIL